MPAASARNLFTSVLRGAALDPTVVPFVHQAPVLAVPPPSGVAAADLGVTFPPAVMPAGSTAPNEEEYTDEIMCRIAAMLPPSYRGVYADHPRLKELLEE